MTTANTVTCPHCGATNVAGAAFCESCGKALPSAVPTGPRVVSADVLPYSSAGHQLVGDELLKQQKRASQALLVVAILQTTCGMLVIAALANMQQQPEGFAAILFAVQLAVAAIFWGLWFWSRKQPLPASIVGLVLYCTLVVLNMITAMSDLAADPDAPRRGFGGLGIGIIDIIIIVMLAQAISAGLKYKRLMQSAGVPA